MDNKKRCRKAGGVWFSCVLVMAMGACERPDPQTELDAATSGFSAGNYEDAALRLNYVVQLDPNNIRARELRGDLALLLGDYANAATEFVLARELGAPRDAIALRLAEAQVAQDQIDEALELLDDSEPALAGDPLYWTLRAEALLSANRLPEAERSIEKAQQVGDGGARTLTARARIAFAGGRMPDAFQWIDQALASSPNDPRVRIAHAELLARTDRLTEAATELQRAADLYREASISPRESLSLLGLVQVHLARNELGAAEAVAERLAQQAPEAQWASYFQALVKLRRGEYDEAASLTQPLVNAFPETIQYRSLLGAIQLARGNVGQAEQQFLRVLSIAPRDPAASKLLAETRLRQQRPRAALDALLAVQDSAAEDPQIGLLSGVATILSGNLEQGLLYLEQAASLEPTNELLKLQLARAYIAAGRDVEASNLLTASFGDDAHAVEANLLQLFAESRRGNAASTASIAEQLIADHPDDPRVLTAVALNYQFNGDTDRARDLFKRAAAIDTGDATAQLFIAASLVQEGRQDDAEILLRDTIRQQPENSQAIAGLGQLLASRGAFDEAAELFSRASGYTSSVEPRLALVQILLRQGNVIDARLQLDEAASSAPSKPEVLALGGIVALAEGRTHDAVTLLERAAPMLPDRLGIALALARARLADGQAAAARDGLLPVVELAPRSFPVQLALGEAELQTGNAEGALSVAANLKAAFPLQAGGYILEGRAFMAMREYAAAGNSLATAFRRQPTWPTLALEIQTLRLAGRSAEALEANEVWLKENPGHAPAELMRAVLLQAAGRTPESFEGYRTVLRVEPDNLVALNNAAWVAHELGEPIALSLAERAWQVAPENAAVLDTYGWILLARGENAQAIEMLSRAAELAPQAPAIRYHLAEALVAGDQLSDARELLAALLTEVRDFDERSSAEQLLESMQTEVASKP